MRKLIFVMTLVLLVPYVSSVSSDFRDFYAPRETMIGELTGGILSPIGREQVKVLRDGHLDVAVEFDVAKLGNRHFIWAVAPANEGQYTLVVEDIVAFVEGSPEVIDYEKDFSVLGEMIDYSIAPGAVIANSEFTIAVTAYEGVTISTDFPEERQITLYPGTSYVDYPIDDVLGVQHVDINLGNYMFPAYIYGADYICGDGRIDDVEVCDGENLNGKSCATLEKGYVGGELACASDCLSFDERNCETPLECDEEHLGLCEDESSCSGAGGYWYDGECNGYEQGAVCDREHVGLCETAGTCLDAGGYWYDGECNEEEQEVCGEDNVTLCETAGTCLDAGGYWYDGFCNVEEAGECGDGDVGGGEECDGEELMGQNCTSQGFDGGNLSCIPEGEDGECSFYLGECYNIGPLPPPDFSIDPGRVNGTVYVEDPLPTYGFVIKNNGQYEIEGISLDYNRAKFLINPDSGISIGPNESIAVNVSIRENWRGTPFEGAIVAYAGDVSEYALLDIRFTEIESEAGTSYARNGTAGGESYYCSELFGYGCGSDESCDGETVSTIDIGDCCLGECVGGGEDSGGGSWIGYLVVGIVLLVVAIIYLRYKGVGKSSKTKTPLQDSIAKAKKNLP